MHLTHRWLDRCITRFGETDLRHGYDQLLFPIAGQHLSRTSPAFGRVRRAADMPGYGIGGTERGRARGGDVRHGRAGMRHPAQGPAALPDGRAPRGTCWRTSPLGVDMFGLRDAHPQRPQRHALHPAGHRAHQEPQVGGRPRTAGPDGHSWVDTAYSGPSVRHLFASGEHWPCRWPACTTWASILR